MAIYRHAPMKADNVHFIYDPLPGQKGGFSIACAEFSVSPEQVCFIIGKNGSGKSTLIKLLGGFSVPGKGKITLNEKPLKNAHIRCLLVGVTDMLVGRLTVLDHFALGLALGGLSTGLFPRLSAAGHLRKRLGAIKGLPEDLRKEVLDLSILACSELSSGQRQLVAAVLAILVTADAIVADETAANLDAENARRLLKLLKMVAQQDKIPIVAVSHDLLLVAEFADCAYIMENGVASRLDLPTEFEKRVSFLRGKMGFD